MPQKPIDQLTKLELLKEIVALQRLRAREGMQGAHRADMTFLRNPSAIGPILHGFQGDWDAMIEYYFENANKEYNKLKLHWSGDGMAFRQLVRERGLQNVVNYKLESKKG